MDPAFDHSDPEHHLHLQTARQCFRDSILADAIVDMHQGYKQKYVSKLVDAKLMHDLRCHPSEES
eukprot:6075602-Karenia_brevis.AAC.1